MEDHPLDSYGYPDLRAQGYRKVNLLVISSTEHTEYHVVDMLDPEMDWKYDSIKQVELGWDLDTLHETHELQEWLVTTWTMLGLWSFKTRSRIK